MKPIYYIATIFALVSFTVWANYTIWQACRAEHSVLMCLLLLS